MKDAAPHIRTPTLSCRAVWATCRAANATELASVLRALDHRTTDGEQEPLTK
jgi:hypothetical protein